MPSVAGSAVVGKSIVIRGELTGEEDLVIEGTIDGSIKLPGGRLTIGANAHVTGELVAQDIVILGVVKGNLNAVERVDLRKTAVLNGDIKTARLSIEEGATVQGRADLTGGSANPGTTPVVRSI